MQLLLIFILAVVIIFGALFIGYRFGYSEGYAQGALSDLGSKDE